MILKPIRFLIKTYQVLFSEGGPLRILLSPGKCCHTPSCSDYFCQVIEKQGILSGTVLGIRRVLTCNPWF